MSNNSSIETFLGPSHQAQLIGTCYLVAGVAFCTLNLVCVVPLILCKEIRTSSYHLIILHIGGANFLQLLIIGFAAGIVTLIDLEVSYSES